MTELTSKVVGISIALLVAAVVLPIGLDQLAGVTGEVDVLRTVTNENFEVGTGAENEFSGNTDNTPLSENTLVIRAYFDNVLTSFTEQSDNEVTVSNYTTGAWAFDHADNVDNNTTILGSYRYVLETREWGDAILIVLTVLLPVLAVIGIILYITKREGD